MLSGESNTYPQHPPMARAVGAAGTTDARSEILTDLDTATNGSSARVVVVTTLVWLAPEAP